MNSKDIVGLRVGRLVVNCLSERGNGLWWLCDCDCGGSVVLRTNQLIGARPTKSCGCLQRDTARATKTTHGKSRTYLYKTWSQIVQRCTNPNNPAFSSYGGRGVKIDEAWRLSFTTFCRDVGNRPFPTHTLDRIDNDGHYAPGNVRWASRTEQARNRRSNRLITANGMTKTLAEWISLSGLSASTVERRLKRGWRPSEAVTSAANQHRRKMPRRK